jgi:sulfur-oxidizing protein SoxA
MFNIFKLLSVILIAYYSTTSISYAELSNSEHIKDLNLIQGYFKKRFPEVPFEDFANGVYALDSIARENWEALEEFPPYEVHIDTGEEYWQAHSSTYRKCFPNGPAIKHQYPTWNDQLNTVVTVPYAINLCRQSHALAKLDYMGMEMNSLVAYIAYQSRGEIIDITVPNEKALDAYQQGKKFYFTRRGQLNFACFHCHFDNAGKKLRTESLGPALGQTTGWPTYRNKWGALGPLHRRYIGCNKQVRAAPFEAQSETYRNLEYFHTHMNNGLPINGPAVRR